MRQDIFEVKLARELLARQLITPEKLEEALRQQVILGGHLATNLWELRLVDGKRLTELSAELLSVPIADAKLVAEAPSEVRRVFTTEFVAKSHILPIRITGSVLQVATAEPWDMLMLGRAAYHGGYPVEPYFLPEVPLSAMLEKLYGIPTSARFWIGVQTNERRAKGEYTPWQDESLVIDTPIARPKSVLMAFVSAEVEKLQRRRRRPGTSGGGASGAGGDARPRLIVQPLTEEQMAEPASQPLAPIHDLKLATAALEEATDRTTVGGTLLRLALSRGRRAMLFVRREATWVGWMAAGDTVDADKAQALSVPDVAETFFGLVAHTGSHYLGPLQPNIAYAPLLLALGGGKPRSVAFLPVRLKGRIIFGLYLDGGADAFVSADIGDVLVLAQRVPAVLERLVAARRA